MTTPNPIFGHAHIWIYELLEHLPTFTVMLNQIPLTMVIFIQDSPFDASLHNPVNVFDTDC